MKTYKYKKSFTFDHKRYYVRADSLEELGEKKANKLHELKSAKQEDSEILVREWAKTCFATYKTGLSDVTLKSAWRRIDHCILAHIGDMRLKDVTPIDCQQVINYQQGHSKSYINKVATDLKFIFSHAVYNDLIQKDPTLMLKKPKGTYSPRRALTELERKVFEEIAVTDRKYYWTLLMLYCGCRPVEALECKGSDIFMLEGKPMLHIRGTKTKNADRNVPIPDALWRIIDKTKKNEYISLYKGEKITEFAKQRIWKGLHRAMNIKAGTKVYRNQLVEPLLIPKDFTPYCLRHEFCSDLARRGIDVRIAQKLMGHSDISLTANIYTHVEDKEILVALGATQGATLDRVKSGTKGQ